ncbi:NAD(P)-binding domain-containing protein, partial [Vibrio cholerae]
MEKMQVREGVNVAFIGLGVMGFPMAGHLSQAGY